MPHEFSRTELLIGKRALEKLKNSKVAVYGIGGVGSYVAEGLARAGVGRFFLVDHDLVCISNVNRQIHAASKTIGRPKVEVMRERIYDINPKAEVVAVQRFYMPGMAQELIRGDENYIVDAIDTVMAKIDLIVNAKERGIHMISSMGTGNKMDPTRFEVTDIYSTSVCPLARVMRRELKQRGVDSLKVVYSKEKPVKLINMEDKDHTDGCLCPEDLNCENPVKRRMVGSISFVPSVAGLIIAGEVVKDIIKDVLQKPT